MDTIGAAVVGLVVVVWALVTQWGGVKHSHPAYAIWLGVVFVGWSLVCWLAFRREPAKRGGWRRAGRIVLVVVSIGVVALTVFLRPRGAIEPALAAMESDSAVTVDESATLIVMAPRGEASGTGVFFEPGALVDGRAYAAVLRPMVEDGHTIVIAKPPFGIAFLSSGKFDEVRQQYPNITGWVVGGHSLGGVVAAINADDADEDEVAPSIGLMFYGSYPAGDISSTLQIPVVSISGTQDGLSTPADIEASRRELPADTEFVMLEGVSHAQFGDYGAQSGDNEAEVSNDAARAKIVEATREFVNSVTN